MPLGGCFGKPSTPCHAMRGSASTTRIIIIMFELTRITNKDQQQGSWSSSLTDGRSYGLLDHCLQHSDPISGIRPKFSLHDIAHGHKVQNVWQQRNNSKCRNNTISCKLVFDCLVASSATRRGLSSNKCHISITSWKKGQSVYTGLPIILPPILQGTATGWFKV